MQTNFTGKSHLDWYLKKRQEPNINKKETNPIYIKLEEGSQEDSKPKIHNSGNDPLLKYPTRAIAYSNEVGEALRPVIGGKANLFYIPSLLYIGADSWDKQLRGKKGDYSEPSPKTGIRQGVFQALASVFLPTAAIHIGQDVAMRSKPGRSVINKISSYLINNKESIATNIEKLPLGKNLGKKLLDGFTNPEAAKDVVNHCKKGPFSFIHSGYDSVIKKVGLKEWKPPTKGHAAIGNVGKAAVGFATLAVAAPIIDKFVEHVVIKKIVNPMLGLRHEGENAHEDLAAQKLDRKEVAQKLKLDV